MTMTTYPSSVGQFSTSGYSNGSNNGIRGTNTTTKPSTLPHSPSSTTTTTSTTAAQSFSTLLSTISSTTDTLTTYFNHQRQSIPIGASHLPFLDDPITSITWETQPRLNAFLPGDILQLSGPMCSGKTEVLMHLILVTVLPMQWRLGRHTDSVMYLLGGKGEGVVFLDTDMRFDIRRLKIVLEKWVQKCVLEQCEGFIETFGNTSDRQSLMTTYLPTTSELSTLINESLQRLFIYTPTSTSDIISILTMLPYTLFTTNRGFHFRFIMIDSITAFVPLDRAEEALLSNHSNSNYWNMNIKLVMKVCKSLLVRYPLAVIVTDTLVSLQNNQNSLVAGNEGLESGWKDQLSNTWVKQFVTYRFRMGMKRRGEKDEVRVVKMVLPESSSSGNSSSNNAGHNNNSNHQNPNREYQFVIMDEGITTLL